MDVRLPDDIAAVKRHAGGVPGRRQTKQYSRDERQQHREARDANIEREKDSFRQRVCRNDRRGRLENRGGQADAERAADRREQQALSDQLSQQANAAAAEGRTNRDFACPSDPTSQKEIGDVGAGHQQHQADDADENRGGGPQVPADQCLPERFHDHAPAFVGVGRHAGNAVRDAGHVGARPFDCDARPQAADDLKIVHLTLLGGALGLEHDPEITGEQDLKVRGDDADDGVRFAVESHDAADDGRIAAEVAAPEPLADHDSMRGRRRIVRAERAARDRQDTKDVEESRRHRLAGNPFGQGAWSGQRPAAAGDGRHRGEGLVLFAPVHIVQRRDAVAGGPGRSFPEHHERIRIAVRQCPEQRRVEQAEDRGCRADAQGEDRDRECSEPGGSPQHASAVSKVAPECHASFDESWRFRVGKIHPSAPGLRGRSRSVG